jgi:hypothetical protein
MRFSHVLLGLVGLAGLAAAAPTSASASVQVVGGVDSSPVDAAGKVPVHARAIEDRPVQTLDAPGLGQGLPQETPMYELHVRHTLTSYAIDPSMSATSRSAMKLNALSSTHSTTSAREFRMISADTSSKSRKA